MKQFLRSIKRKIMNASVAVPFRIHGMRLAHAPLRMYIAGIHEPGTTQFCEQYIQPDWVVADIGAHFGYYSVLFSGLAKKTFVIEADARNIPTIKANLKRNHREADVLNLAAFSHSTTVSLNTTENRGTSSIFGEGEAQRVPADALDNRIEHLDFFKMDIEGAEQEALDGMRRLLETVRGFVMEFSPKQLWARSMEPSDILIKTRQNGFTISLIQSDGTLKEMLDDELTRYASSRGHVNVFCKRI